MFHRIHALATALTLATLGQASAAEPALFAKHPTFHTPAVIGAAYHNRSVATNAVEVRRQGGFMTAGAVQWLPASSEKVAAFSVPGVIGAAYRDRRIATSPAEVRRQGGFATAGAVQWLPAGPTDAEAQAERVRLGAL